MSLTFLSVATSLLLTGYGLKSAIDAVRTVTTKKPIDSRVVANSYGEASSRAEREAHPFDWMYSLSPLSAKPAVGNDLAVRYKVDGVDHQTVVHVAHLRGERPDAHLLLWYHPNRPALATAERPGRDAAFALGFLAAAALTIWYTGV